MLLLQTHLRCDFTQHCEIEWRPINEIFMLRIKNLFLNIRIIIEHSLHFISIDENMGKLYSQLVTKCSGSPGGRIQTDLSESSSNRVSRQRYRMWLIFFFLLNQICLTDTQTGRSKKYGVTAVFYNKSKSQDYSLPDPLDTFPCSPKPTNQPCH